MVKKIREKERKASYNGKRASGRKEILILSIRCNADGNHAAVCRK